MRRAYAKHILTICDLCPQNTITSPSDDDSDVSDYDITPDETSLVTPRVPDIPLLMGLSAAEVQQFGLVVSTNNRSKISIKEIQEHSMMPDYPHTVDSESPTEPGILHFIHCSNPIPESLDPTDPKYSEQICNIFSKEMSRIQFSISNTGTAKLHPIPLLSRLDNDNTSSKVWHRSYSCSGVKYCHQLDQALLLPGVSGIQYDNFNRVDLRYFKALWAQRQHSYHNLGPKDLLKQKTEHFYLGFLRNWEKGCNDRESQAPCCYQGAYTCPDDVPVVFSRNKREFLGCPKNSDTEPWHMAQSINPLSAQLDTLYLKYLTEHQHQKREQPGSKCVFLTQVNSKFKYCDQAHIGGRTTLEVAKCNSRFDLFIPENWHRFPYMMLVTRGRHGHPPPPPSRLPQDIADEVCEMLQKEDIISLTAKRFLISPSFINIRNQFGPSILRTLHASLNIEDRISGLIRKQRLLQYPDGTDLAGVIREFEFDKKKPYNQWIRDIYFFEDNPQKFIILCCLDEQARAFQTARYLEIDLSFKMIQGKTNVFSLVGWSDEHQCILTYAYAFMNTESRAAYHILFRKVFEMLTQLICVLSKHPALEIIFMSLIHP
ncbi:uncharacterized protein BDV14DRAFT_160917 [Aspergillus stella-maris]|uniref:uncharacterized protein n=1 Tax=Aspergillus stella-maris TaxID=1810926 RepID=UPI003CCDF595